MHKLTGQSKMDARPLMEYFKPLMEYLKSQNGDDYGWQPQCPPPPIDEVTQVSESVSVVEPGERCHLPADIIFLVDASSAVWITDFNRHVKKFLKDLIVSFNVGLGPNDKRVGVLLFSNETYLQFHLNGYQETTYSLIDRIRSPIQTVKEKLCSVEAMRHRGGLTHTHKALEYAASEMLKPENGARPAVHKIVIVLTFGMPIDMKKTIDAAKSFKDKGVDIIYVGIGSRISSNELKALTASQNEQFVFATPDFRTLDSIKNRLATSICELLTATTTELHATLTTTTASTTTPTTTKKSTTTSSTTNGSSTATSTELPSKKQNANTMTICGDKPADIYFLLDSSNSIWIVHFHNYVLPFVRDLVSSFHISPSHTRIGLVTFSNNVSHEFNLSTFADQKTLMEKLQKEHIEYLSGNWTETGKAIQYVTDVGFGPDHGREWVVQIIIAVTDGMSQDPHYTAHAAAEAKKKGIIMFVIGIGTLIDDQELSDISSDPDKDFKFQVDNFTDMSSIKLRIANQVCAVIDSHDEIIKKCSRMSISIMLMYEYLNHVSSFNYIIDNLIDKFIEKAARISPDVNIGVLTQNCIGDGVKLSNVSSFQADITKVRQCYSKGYLGLMMKLKQSVFNNVPKENRNVAILIVDKMTRNLELLGTEIHQLKAMNVEIFVVAIGGVKPEVLNTLTSAPYSDHIIEVKKEIGFKATNMDVLKMVCGLNFEKETKD